MRTFNYSAIREQKWDSEILGLVAAVYKEAGKQELYLKQRPEELEKLVEIAKVQSTEASNAIEGIVTTNTRIRQLVEEKTTPRNRDEQEIAGYRDVLNLIHENFDAIPITQNYILQLHKIFYSHMNNPMAGRTKNVQNYISATYPDGHVETLFTPLAPYETPEALDRICEEYNRVIGNMEVEPLIVITVFIHDFLCIHPFNDGNGRMSRLQRFCRSFCSCRDQAPCPGDCAPSHHGEGRPVYQAGHPGTLPLPQHQLHRGGAAEIGGRWRIETGGCWKEHLLLQIKMIYNSFKTEPMPVMSSIFLINPFPSPTHR